MMRILIVEDDPTDAIILTRALGKAGHVHTLHADSIRAALPLLTQCDLAVVDIALPDGDGWELLEPCAAVGVPVTFMSGSPIDKLAALSLSSGCATIEKTAEDAELLGQLKANQWDMYRTRNYIETARKHLVLYEQVNA